MPFMTWIHPFNIKVFVLVITLITHRVSLTILPLCIHANESEKREQCLSKNFMIHFCVGSADKDIVYLKSFV